MAWGGSLTIFKQYRCDKSAAQKVWTKFGEKRTNNGENEIRSERKGETLTPVIHTSDPLYSVYSKG